MYVCVYLYVARYDKWFGCMERMSEERVTKRVYVSEVEGTRRRWKTDEELEGWGGG